VRIRANPKTNILKKVTKTSVSVQTEPVNLGGPDNLRRSETGAFVTASFEFTVRTHDIPGGVQQLRQNGRNSIWIAFLFGTAKISKATDDQSLALQYSVDHGLVGLEWVLLGPRNIADREFVSDFMRRRGHTVQVREQNGVNFLRVEDGDLGALGQSIAEKLYGATANAELGLLIDGLWLSKGRQGVN
jgi:hypothetical protein